MKDDLGALVQYRMEQADAALSDAKYLLDGDRSPQSVINRAYYAMFYAGLALLQKTGKIPSKHAGVIGLFDTEFALKGVFPRELSPDLTRPSRPVRCPITARCISPPERQQRRLWSGHRASFAP